MRLNKILFKIYWKKENKSLKSLKNLKLKWNNILISLMKNQNSIVFIKTHMNKLNNSNQI